MEKSNLVSARKFRPQNFEQIVGQKHIVRTLTNALDNGRAAHAYLFSGTRGVGKTTTARILAKALNCVNGPTSKPCMECDNCMEIAAGNSMDVIEIDGASNTGVDNIRDLKENVMFTPSKSRNKIYIIDEVHQISKAAFNALLKTLEEPPAHVAFIFATTELNKVPETIMSRCQCFEYKSISMNDIAAQLKMIAGHNEVDATPGAIEIVSRRARGSMRDAQSMFDQAAAYGGGSVTEDDVKLILGLVDRSTLFKTVDAVIAKDKAGLLALAQDVGYSGSEPGLFLEDLAGVVRNVMVAKYRPEGLSAFDSEEIERLKGWGAKLEYDELQRFFDTIITAIGQMRLSPQPMLSMEMLLLRLTEKRSVAKIDDMIEKIGKAQTALERSAPEETFTTTPSTPLAQPAPGPVNLPPIEFESNIEFAPDTIQQAVGGHRPEDLLAVFKNSRPILLGIMEHATVQVKGDVVVIIVDNLHSREQLEEPENKELLENLAAKHLNREIRIIVEFHDKKKSEDGDVGGKAQERKLSVQKQVLDTPIIQEALDIFEGEVIDFKVIKHL